jgi:hypothetical protein
MHRLSNMTQLSASKTDHSRRGNAVFLTLVVLVLLLAAGAYFLGPSLLARIDPGKDSGKNKAMTHTVRRENLVVTVNDDGELKSASNVDVKC